MGQCAIRGQLDCKKCGRQESAGVKGLEMLSNTRQEYSVVVSMLTGSTITGRQAAQHTDAQSKSCVKNRKPSCPLSQGY